MKAHKVTANVMCFCTAAAILGLLPSIAVSQQWQIAKIAGEDLMGSFPRISDGNVVWQRSVGGDLEIFHYDGSTITQLTDNEVPDYEPDISGDHVAWYSGDRSRTDIVYDGTIVMGGVKNQTDMFLEPGGLIWSAIYPYDRFGISHVYLHDGSTTKKLSVESTRHNHNPDMSGSNVVWSGFNENGASAYFYDGTSTIELPENVGLGQIPKISSNNIVGIGIDPDEAEDQVFLFDGVTNHQLGHTDGRDTHQKIDGQNVAWLSEVNGVYEVFTYENGQAKQLSFNSVKAYAPYVSESFVVWSADKGSGYQLYAYDGIKTTFLLDGETRGAVNDASGNSFVWSGKSGAERGVFVATYVIPEPSTFLLAALGFMLAVSANRSCRDAAI